MLMHLYQAAIDKKPFLRTLAHNAVPTHSTDTCTDFTTNDYLGVNHLADIQQQTTHFLQTLLKQPYEDAAMGATGARLISGKHPVFAAFEAEIASAKHQEKALLFCSGYQANATVLASLLKPDAKNTWVFSDKLNHASLHHACQTTGIRQQRYQHLNLAHLQTCLEKAPAGVYKWIVSETVFGMDGDTVDLPKLIELAKLHQAGLYLDEAHATGLYGECGYGITTLQGVDFGNVPVCIMGTLGKAIGGAGAYVACNSVLQQYLINFCGGFIYSTAPSPIDMQLARHIWQQVPTLFKRHVPNILNHARHLRTVINQLPNLHACELAAYGDSHIVMIKPASAIISSAFKHRYAVVLRALHQHLQHHGVYASLILPPTVPVPALRFAICAHHTQKEIVHVCHALAAFSSI